jgi:hypothetical protein
MRAIDGPQQPGFVLPSIGEHMMTGAHDDSHIPPPNVRQHGSN